MNILRALSRVRFPIFTIAAPYLLSVLLGIFMVHSQNHFALARRDKLVGAAQQSQILTQLNAGHPFRAATLDFAGNLVAGISSTVSGFCVPLAYPMAAYRGWVGGIVSVDGEHKSRFARPKTALYYVVVMLMQILPYSLAEEPESMSVFRCFARASVTLARAGGSFLSNRSTTSPASMC